MNFRVTLSTPVVGRGGLGVSPVTPTPVVQAVRKRPALPGEPERASAGPLAILPDSILLALQGGPEADDGRAGSRQGT